MNPLTNGIGCGKIALLQWCKSEVYQIKMRGIWVYPKKGSRDIKCRFKNGEDVNTVRLGTQALNVKTLKILLTRSTSAMLINFLGARFWEISGEVNIQYYSKLSTNDNVTWLHWSQPQNFGCSGDKEGNIVRSRKLNKNWW